MSADEKMKPWSRRIAEKEWTLVFDPKPKIAVPPRRRAAVVPGGGKRGKREKE